MVDAKGAVLAGASPSKGDTEKTLRRDAFVCRCCGFESKKYQRVIASDLLSPDGGADGFVTVCPLCELAAMLERAGQTGAGQIVWLPEMSQAEVSHLARALYIAKAGANADLAKAAARTLDVLAGRRAEAKKRLGTDDPLILAAAMAEQVNAPAYAARQKKMEGLRLLPLGRYFVPVRGRETDVFPQMIAYWTSPEGPFGKLPVDAWSKLFEETSAKAAG